MANFLKARFIDDDIIEVLVPKKSDVILLSNKENLSIIENKIFSIANKKYIVKVVFQDNAKDEDLIIKNLKDILGDTLKIIK